MRTIIKEILNWTWCLPQTLLGLILAIIYKAQKKTLNLSNKTVTYYEWTYEGGSISLGKYIMLCEGHSHSKDIYKHEYGHQIQSYILGPLYLLVIGLPSILWANFFWNPKKHKYSWFYTEKWADKLGGVYGND